MNEVRIMDGVEPKILAMKVKIVLRKAISSTMGATIAENIKIRAIPYLSAFERSSIIGAELKSYPNFEDTK